jgi:hypothetical protein
MILSDRSVCMIPHQGIKLAFLKPTSDDGYMWSSRYGWRYKAYLYLIILQSQKPDPRRKLVVDDMEICNSLYDLSLFELYFENMSNLFLLFFLFSIML